MDSMPSTSKTTTNGVEDSSKSEDSDASSSNASTSTIASKNTKRNKKTKSRSRKRRKAEAHRATENIDYKYVMHFEEDHKKPIFGASFNFFDTDHYVFATVGSNRVMFYECIEETVELLQIYRDPDPKEIFYTCAWTVDVADGTPLIAAGGERGIIRIINPDLQKCIRELIGHGASINDLVFHPRDPEILLSASKDHSVRLWHISNDRLIAVFGGVEGHRDEVLSADFHREGKLIVSAGMDHALKVWDLQRKNVQLAITTAKHTVKKFTPLTEHFPIFTTRDIHTNYVDCVRTLGELFVSKSCENEITIWRRGGLSKSNEEDTDENSNSILYHLKMRDGEIWFLRFSIDFYKKVLVCGNTKGAVFVWDLQDSDLNACKILTHTKCSKSIRQTTISKDGNIIICVCDDGTVWRWDRKKMELPEKEIIIS